MNLRLRKFFLLLFLAIGTSSIGISQIEYFNETSKWLWVDFGRKISYSDYGHDDMYHQLKAIEEVDLNGQIYMKFEHATKVLHYEWSDEIAYWVLDQTSVYTNEVHMRQEGKKVYILDQKTEIINNYDLEVGDTLYRINGNAPEASGIVDSIYDISFNGQSRKAFIIDQIIFPSFKYLMFEGIGTDEGLFDMQSHNHEQVSYLLCYEMDDEPFPVDHFDDIIQGNIEVSCNAFTVQSRDLTQDRLHVYPVPTMDIIYVNFDFDLTNSSISIISLDGKFHHIASILHNDRGLEIDVSNLAPGTYFLQFINDERRLTKKFVKI